MEQRIIGAEDGGGASGRRLQGIVPSVIIGLGGTGGEVLLRVRKKFFEASTGFGLDEWPVIKYLYIDTDLNDRDVGRYHGHFYRFARSEFFPATLDDWAAYTRNLQNYPSLRKWWYEDQTPLRSPALNEGAGQIRGYSRLAMWKHAKEISGRVSNLVKEVRAPNANKFMACRGVAVRSDKVWVYVVGSLAGGTGSGAFIDLGYMIRQMPIPGLETMAFMVMPSAFEYLGIPQDRLKANAYASLSELEYFSSLELRKGSFEDQWSNGQPKDPICSPPYARVFLVDGENLANVTVGAEEAREGLLDMIADHIFLDYTVSHFGDAKRSAYVNQDQHLHEIYAYEHRDPGSGNRVLLREPFSQAYQTFGVSRLYIPLGRIKKACSFELWSRAFTRFSESLSTDRIDQVRERVLKDDRVPIFKGVRRVRGRGEPIDDFAKNLKAADGGATVDQLVCEGIRELRRRTLEGADPERRRSEYVSGEFEAMVDEFFLQPVSDRSGYREWGTVYRRMESNRLAYLERVKSDVKGVAVEFASDPARGIGFGMEFAEEIKRYLTSKSQGLAAQWGRDVTENGKRVKATRAAYDTALVDLSTHESWGLGHAPLLKGITVRHDIEAVCHSAEELFLALVEERFLRDAIEVANDTAAFASELVAELKAVQERLVDLGSEFERRAAEFKEETVSPLNECPYEPSDVGSTYMPKALLGRNEGSEADLNDECLRRASRLLGDFEHDLGGNSRTGLSLYDIPAAVDAWGTDRLETRLAAAALGEFSALDEINVVSIFAEKVVDPDRRKARISSLVKRSLPWFARHRAFSKHQAKDTTFVCSLRKGSSSEFDEFQANVEEAMTADFPSIMYQESEQQDCVVFFTQMAGFPLCFGAAIDSLHPAYEQSSLAGSDRLHISREEWRFPSIVNLSARDVNQLREATEAFLVGIALGAVKVKMELLPGTTTERCIYYYAHNEHGITRERQLGTLKSGVRKLINEQGTQTEIREQIERRFEELDESGGLRFAQALLRHYFDKDGPYGKQEFLNARDDALERIPMEHVVLSDAYGERFGSSVDSGVEEMLVDLDSFSAVLPDGHRVLLEQLPSRAKT